MEVLKTHLPCVWEVNVKIVKVVGVIHSVELTSAVDLLCSSKLYKNIGCVLLTQFPPKSILDHWQGQMRRARIFWITFLFYKYHIALEFVKKSESWIVLLKWWENKKEISYYGAKNALYHFFKIKCIRQTLTSLSQTKRAKIRREQMCSSKKYFSQIFI